MQSIVRRSPVVFDRTAAKKVLRDHWEIVLVYKDEGAGPQLVDLSHRPRWDIQDGKLDRCRPWQASVPRAAGRCTFENGLLISRMNRTQACIWHLAGGRPDVPDDPAYTETTDAGVFLALLGEDIFAVAEKLSALDFRDPSRRPPFLLQGPFCHVPCQIVVMERSAERAGLLLTCSRGYARDMVNAVLDAGQPFGLQPAGEASFSNWIDNLRSL